MADTRVQRNPALWVRENWLPQKYGISFRNEAVALSSGGQYRFDAISGDNSTVAAISTSRATRASGGLAVGKLNKIRADIRSTCLESTGAAFRGAECKCEYNYFRDP